MQIVVVKVTALEMNKDEWMINAYSGEVMGGAERQTTGKKK